LVSVVALSASWSFTAHAGDVTLAETLFREGKTLMESGDYSHACPKLAESFRQDPATGTLLALAQCQERAGHLASAWATYSEAAARARAEGRSDRDQAARERGSALEPRLSRLTVELADEVASLPGLIVKRDDERLPSAAWGSAVPVDPGKHTIEVTASGKRPFRRTIEIGPEKDQQTVRVSALEAGDPGGASNPSGQRQGATETPATGSADDRGALSSSSPLKTAGLIVGGAGVIGLGIGSVFGLKASGLNSDSNANGHCDSTGCDSTGYDLRNDALDAARVSTALFIVGGVLVAGGVTLYFVGGSPAERPTSRVALTPIVGPAHAGVWLHGGF
jgi:hypothetical protein